MTDKIIMSKSYIIWNVKLEYLILLVISRLQNFDWLNWIGLSDGLLDINLKIAKTILIILFLNIKLKCEIIATVNFDWYLILYICFIIIDMKLKFETLNVFDC